MAENEVRFSVAGDRLYSTIDRRMTEIKRQVTQDGGSPIDPEIVADVLQLLIDGKIDGLRHGFLKEAVVVKDGFKDFGLNPSNPSPFRQPFLVVHFKDGKEWYIDVDGRLDLYLKDWRCGLEGKNYLDDATPLLQAMIGKLRAFELMVGQVEGYCGSAGPSHFIRHGVLFRRIGEGFPLGV